MPESMKNRDVLPVGTRVRLAHDKISTREGEVMAHTEDGRMMVHWDGDMIVEGVPRVKGPFMPAEIKEVKK